MHKLACVIDTLNSGGAQRQMVSLINYLLLRDVDVKLFVVYPIYNIENQLLDLPNLSIEKNQKGSYLSTFKSLFRYSRIENCSTFLSYLNGPNYLLIFLKILNPRISIFLSERRGFKSNLSLYKSLKYFPYTIANSIIFNSEDTLNKISFYCFPIKFKSKVIHNLTHVVKNERASMAYNRFSLIANYRPEKNHELLLRTVREYKIQYKDLVISCYGNNFFVEGRPTLNSNCYIGLLEFINNNNLCDIIQLNSHFENVNKIYSNSEFILMLSKFEGFPNVVCEAMMSGSIIISTKVSDLEKFIIHKVNGYILEDSTPKELNNAILWALNLSLDDRNFASKFNIKVASMFFSFDSNGDKYFNLLNE